MERLNLTVEDKDDLEVVAAHLQDAVTVVGDLAYLPVARRFAGMFNRFRWEDADKGRRTFERVRSGLHFENVLDVKARNIARDRPDGVLNLLTIAFEETDAPSGVVTLVFSGGGELRLEVEALDAQLRDLPLGRLTASRPHHDLEGA